MEHCVQLEALPALHRLSPARDGRITTWGVLQALTDAEAMERETSTAGRSDDDKDVVT